ncbi:GyrI-like domain-containing protein [Microbacterium sp. EST19A]|uniref:GyrI-like domain-containing protein n=1 Tax=Microbacterium sp. EST19A TaxID=2862681 RepID=UPI001CBC57FD|nr:GyrI-like domain-containing protein [Microbacterium sp. EST19A]
MAEPTITEKPLPSVRLGALSESVASQPEVAPVVGPLFDRVAETLIASGAELGVPVAVYEMDESGVRITVGFVYDGPQVDGIDIVELPAAASALTAVHHGVMATIDQSWDAVFTAIGDRGLRAEGPCREVYLTSESDDQIDWVTELQQPVTAP